MARLGAISAVFLGAGCAEPASVGPMVSPRAARAVAAPADPALAHAVCVERVRGGKRTNPLWVSEVDNRSFLEALRQSLGNHGLLAVGDDICRFGIEAHLLGLSQPFIGLDVEVTSNVNYRVRKPGDPEPYLLSTTQASHLVRFSSDKVLWGVRLKAANEGAVRKNIQSFIDQLMQRPPG